MDAGKIRNLCVVLAVLALAGCKQLDAALGAESGPKPAAADTGPPPAATVEDPAPDSIPAAAEGGVGASPTPADGQAATTTRPFEFETPAGQAAPPAACAFPELATVGPFRLYAAGAYSGRKLGYPDERRVSALKARDSGRHLVGNYGLRAPYDALLRIDPEAKALKIEDVLAVPGGQAACQFELSGNGNRLANLTPDGKLRIYEIAPTWKELAAFEAVPAFDCAYGAKTPTPNLAVIGGNAFVSDPTNGRIREYHLDTLKQGLDMPVGGMPANLAGSDAG